MATVIKLPTALEAENRRLKGQNRLLVAVIESALDPLTWMTGKGFDWLRLAAVSIEAVKATNRESDHAYPRAA